MLEYKELMEIIESEGIECENYSLPYLRNLYGNSIHKSKLLPIIETMILATLDPETPLYDVLEVAESFESENNITNYSCATDLLDVVISNMEITRENAERLIDLIKEADIVSAYNTLFSLFVEHLTESELEDITAQRATVFDSELLL